jgi:hypothetical protein
LSGAPPLRLASGAARPLPVPGPDGQILCGGVQLADTPRDAGGPGLELAAAWHPDAGWRAAALPPRLSFGARRAAVGFLPSGDVYAVHGSEIVTSRAAERLPQPVHAFVVDANGVMFAAVAWRDQQPTLYWTAGFGVPWRPIDAIEPVTALAASGEKVYAAGPMLGHRMSGSLFGWTPWPAGFRPDGLGAEGERVVAWGGPLPGTTARGVLIVSRDGGRTLRTVPLERLRPAHVAVDPHADGFELLVRGDDGMFERVRLPAER